MGVRSCERLLTLEGTRSRWWSAGHTRAVSSGRACSAGQAWTPNLFDIPDSGKTSC